jgi:hypothetical protein
MVATIQQTPISFLFTPNDKNLIVPNNRIAVFLQKIHELLEKSDLALPNTLLDELLSIRHEILIQGKKEVENLPNLIADEIIDHYKNSKNSKLSEVVYQTLSIYLQMLPPSAKGIGSTDIKEIPTLHGLELLCNMYQNLDLHNLLHWYKYSLSYECYLLMADIVLQSKVEMNKTNLDNLTSALKTSFINFASYSHIVGTWKINQDEENQLLRNIKIKTATIEMSLGKYKVHTFESAKQMILN